MRPDRTRGVRLLVQPWLLSSLQSPFPVPPCNLNTSCSNDSPVGGFIPSNIIGHSELCNILPWITKTMKCLNSSGEQEWFKKKVKRKCGYLIAPCTRGLRKNRANCEVTSSRSLALSTKASTFVEHLTVRIATNRMPWNLILALSETAVVHVTSQFIKI